MALPKQDLENTRTLNRHTKELNKRAGATYEDIPERQRFSFGEGSQEARAKQSLTVPTTAHEYRGFRLVPHTVDANHWTVESIEFPNPISLRGKFTDVASAEKAVDQWHSSEALKDNLNRSNQ